MSTYDRVLHVERWLWVLNEALTNAEEDCTVRAWSVVKAAAERSGSYLGFLAKKDVLSSLTLLADGAVDNLTTFASNIYALFQWKEEGQTCYLITDDLLEGMGVTELDLDRVPSDCVRLPNRAFYIEYETPIPLQEDIADGVRYNVIGALVNGSLDDNTGAADVSVLLISGPEGRRPEPTNVLMWPSVLHLRPGMTLTDALERTGLVSLPLSNEEAGRHTKLVLNILLYLTSEEVALQHRPAPADVYRAELRKPGLRRRQSLSRNAVVASKLRRVVVGLYTDPLMVIRQGQGGPVSWHMVRGHWRWQAYGDGYRKHKHIFIDEHERGDPTVGIVVKTYVATEDKHGCPDEGGVPPAGPP